MSNNYADAGHRPHARHTGEAPKNEIKEAPYHLSVTLDTWGPVNNLFPSLYDALQSNWGDEPSRAVDYDGELFTMTEVNFELMRRTGWDKLSASERAYVESCFARKTLQQVLERITFSFLIDGCTRACTHQLVRTRIGAAMMQHGGRDNDWRHRPWVMPETIRRACEEIDGDESAYISTRYTTGLKSCITDMSPIRALLKEDASNHDYQEKDARLADVIGNYLREGRALYAALVDAGIPWEDARRLLWMGTATYIHIDYNYIALRDVLANRLEHIMDWEINCVAQLMLREIKMKCPPVFSKYLGSHSDLAKVDKFAGLQSWPPVGKWPIPKDQRDLPREHRPEQNPFWVLHPDSMNGGPIRWIATNGTYPHEELKGQ